MNRISKARFLIFVLILFISVGSTSAQKKVTTRSTILPTFAEDTAINPHDFTNDYYEAIGIVGKTILNRRSGSDGLSVFSKSSNPSHTDVRIIATLPAYDQFGNMLFWYQLGEVPDYGFTADKAGAEMREMAKLFPIYVFPTNKIRADRLFFSTRQAALIDDTWSVIIGQDLNPMGVREIVFVRYTEKAFSPDGEELMKIMAEKNGLGSDDTPILKTIDDIRIMMKFELVTTAPLKDFIDLYAIAPMIYDPMHGVIAKDAFLAFATKDGTPLPTEQMFATQFGCLQESGTWCRE